MKFEVIITRDDGTTAVLATADRVPAMGARVWSQRCDSDAIAALTIAEGRAASFMCGQLYQRLPIDLEQTRHLARTCEEVADICAVDKPRRADPAT